MAARIQRQRTRGWRMPDSAVYVGRPSKWGNPFAVTETRDALACCEAYRLWLTVPGYTAGVPDAKQWILDHIEDLRGKDLACWCRPGQPCHADVLLDLANPEPPKKQENDDG